MNRENPIIAGIVLLMWLALCFYGLPLYFG